MSPATNHLSTIERDFKLAVKQTKHKDIVRAKTAAAVRRELFKAKPDKYKGKPFNKARECARRLRQVSAA